MTYAQRTIIHIGMHKTATTLLQKKLISENSRCTSYGLRESKDPQSLQYQFLEEVFSEEFDLYSALRLIDEIDRKASSVSITALSNECISTAGYMQSPPGIRVGKSVDRQVVLARLAKIFPGGKILLTIRNQPDFIYSYYLQMFKAKRVKMSFFNWLEGELRREKNIFQVCDYCSLLDLAEDNFHGSVEVLPYEWIEKCPKKYFERLGVLFDISATDVATCYQNNVENKRLSNLSYLLNSTVPIRLRTRLKRIQGVTRAYRMFSEASGGVEISYNKDHLNYVQSKFRASNKKLQSRLGVSLDQLGYFT